MTALLLVLSLVACKKEPAAECIDHGGCPAGNACIEGACEPVQCLTSSDCNLHEFCDARSFACRAGCSDDGDCYAGETCDTATKECVEYACRSTDLDCEIGEFCVDGECEKDDAPHCQACDPYDSRSCPQGSDCWVFDSQTLDAYCLVRCERDGGNDQCPRGFECTDVTGMGDFACSAWCPTLVENGWL